MHKYKSWFLSNDAPDQPNQKIQGEEAFPHDGTSDLLREVTLFSDLIAYIFNIKLRCSHKWRFLA